MDTRNNRVKRELPTNTTATMFNSVTKLSSTAHHRGDNNDAKIGESLNEKGNAAAQEAIRLAIMTLPVYTGFGLLALIAGQSNKGGERVEVMRVLGAPLTVIYP